MDELVKLVAQKTGLPEAQAKAAAETVVKYLKDKLPAPLAGQIDGLLAGGGAANTANDLLKNVGGLFGQKK